MRILSPSHAALLTLTGLIAVAPLFFPSLFYYRIGALIFINGFAVTGLVILIGYAGQISLGHAGFSGIGAYACALGPVHLGLAPLPCLVLGAVLSGSIAWVTGLPILRLRGHYLAVATLAFGVLVFMILNNEAHLTGGPDGIPVQALGLRALLQSMGLAVKASQLWYWLAASVMLVGMVAARNLYGSPTGRALRALHDSEIAARTIGVDVAGYKLKAFVISAVYASVAGSLLAMFNQFTSPDISSFLHSIEMVTMTVLGGAGTVFGAVLGATILTVLPQALAIFHDFEQIMLGLIMMLVMIFMRDGLAPGLARLVRR